MKITNAGFTILPTPRTPREILQHIERCGRVCYKSEERITPESAQGFISGIISRGHEAVLEHGTLAYRLTGCPAEVSFRWYTNTLRQLYRQLRYRCYLRFSGGTAPLISGNARAWRDFLRAYALVYGGIPRMAVHMVGQFPALFPEYQDEKPVWETGMPEAKSRLTEYGSLPMQDRLLHRDVSVLFTVDRGISHEIVRHRPASFCQESTRYCNYAAGRFGRQITVVEPKDLSAAEYGIWKKACQNAETAYFDLIDCGCAPQLARGVLPNSTKTEIVMTANLAEWGHFFGLRTAPAAHPQIREVAIPLLRAFKKLDPSNFGAIPEGETT